MADQQLDDATLAELSRRRKTGEEWAELGRLFNVKGKVLKKRVQRWERRADSLPAEPEKDNNEEGLFHPVTGKPLPEKGDLLFEDRCPQPTDADVESLWNAYLGVMRAARPFKTAQRTARVRVRSDLPTGITFFGDQHTGTWSQAAERMLEDYRLIAQAEGVYCCFLGDEVDNFIFDFGKWASVMPPDHQRVITEWLSKQLRHKSMAWVLGNHPHWSKKMADVDLIARLAWLEEAIYLGHRGDLYLTLGTEAYHLHLCHRAPGGSAINKSNSGRRVADNIGGADVIAEAHRHDPWSHQEYRAGKRQTWLRCGTYKLDDDFADEFGFPTAHWDMPMTIFFPDRHRVVPFWDFRDGLSYLKAVRAEYQARQVRQE